MRVAVVNGLWVGLAVGVAVGVAGVGMGQGKQEGAVPTVGDRGLRGEADDFPGLTQGQRVQLETAVDGSGLVDEPALYGLLANVAEWPERVDPESDPGVTSGAESRVGPPTVWAEVLESPAAWRGQLVMVEGRYAGRQRRMELLRAGPWGSALTEWGIAVDHSGSPTAGDEPQIVMVYFVDPDAAIVPPRRGTRVRVEGYFYKLWSDVDASGRETTYPVVVARTFEVVTKSRALSSAQKVAAALVAGVVSLLLLLWWVRRFVRNAAAGRHRQGVRERLRRDAERHDGEEAVSDPDDPADRLPKDPAAALEALRDAEEGKK